MCGTHSVWSTMRKSISTPSQSAVVTSFQHVVQIVMIQHVLWHYTVHHAKSTNTPLMLSV